MKKHLSFLMLLAALIVPWVAKAQGCTPISTFPVTYGFEATEGFTTTVTSAAACTTNVFNACWRNEQTTFTGSTGSGRIWHIYGGTTAAQIHSGTQSLTLPNKGAATGLSTTMLTFPAMDFSSSNGYVVSFWIYRNGTGTNPEGIKVYASNTDTIDANAVLLGQYSRHYTLAYPQAEAASGWYQYETAPIALTGTVYIIFEGQSYYGSSTYIDDVTIAVAPSCPKPSNVVVDSISYDAANITWSDPTSAASSFRVYYGTAPNIDITTATYVTASDTSVLLSNLQPLTTYYYVVVSDCGGGDNSVPTSEGHFTTLRNCGDGLVNINDAVSYGSSSSYTQMTYNYNGTNYAVGHTANIFTAEEMIGLGVEGPGTIYSISVHASATATVVPMKIYIGKTALTEFSAATDTVGMLANMTLVFDDTLRTTPGEWFTIPFTTPFEYSPDSSLIIYFFRPSVPTGNGTFYYTSTSPVYRSFYGYRSSTSTAALSFTRSSNRNDVKFDICYEVPSCTRPSNVAHTATANSVTLTWTGCDNATEYLVTYNILGGAVSSVSSSLPTVTINNLVPGSDYEFTIVSICGSDTSYAENYSATTECGELNILPYTQTFEGAPTGSATSITFVNCMNRLNNGTTNFGYPYVSASAAYNVTPGGTKGLYWYDATTTGTYGDYQCVVMPAVDTDSYPINTLQLRFWARATVTSYHPVFQVGVMTDPDSINTFQLVQTVAVEGTTYTEFTVPLGEFDGYGQYIAIKAVRPTTAWYATVDDITIETMPACPRIVDLEAVATVSNALLTWGYQEGYDEPAGYELTYDSIGGSNPVTLNLTSPTATLTGLVARTDYKAYLRADCNGEYGIMDSIEFTTGPNAFIDLTSGTAGTSYYLPIGNYYNYSYTQQIVTAAEMGGAATLTGIDFQYAYSSATTQKSNVTIYLANTTATTLSSAFVTYSASTFVPVYTGNMNCTQGWNHFQFTTPFQYDGTSNLLIVVHDNSGAYPGSAYIYATHSAPAGSGRYVQNDSSPYTLSSITGGTSVSYRANMHLHKDDNGVITCAAPAALVTDITGTTADVAWIPGYNETSWDLSYREVSATTWTEAATGVTTTTYQFTNLTPGTDYEFRVSFECNDADNTVYSTTVSGRTLCQTISIPYTYGFEGLPTGSTTVRPDIPCWHHINNGSTYFGYPYVYASAARTGTRGMYWYGSRRL